MKFHKFFLIAAAAFSLTLTSCVTSDIISDLLINSQDPSGVAVGQAMKSIQKANEKFTPENEYYVGRSVAAAVLNKYDLDKSNPELNLYLNEICSALTVNSSMPYLYNGYYVSVLNTQEINAISTPGGHILISKGLINAAESEDALAAVIAHEVAHIQLKHSIEAIKSSRNSAAALSSVKAANVITYDILATDNPELEAYRDAANGLWDMQNVVMARLLESGFSKSQEYNADKYAVSLLIDAGYDPTEMISMLNNISSNRKKIGWNRTHPSAKSRSKKVAAVLKKTEVPESTKELRQERFYRIVK